MYIGKRGDTAHNVRRTLYSDISYAAPHVRGGKGCLEFLGGYASPIGYVPRVPSATSTGIGGQGDITHIGECSATANGGTRWRRNAL